MMRPLKEDVGEADSVEETATETLRNLYSTPWFDRIACKLWLPIRGTMPIKYTEKSRSRRLMIPLTTLLRGVSQTVLINNPVSGFIILLALMMEAKYSTLLGIGGLVSSTLMAKVCGLNRVAIENGVFGYNGLLIGLALGEFHIFGDPGWGRIIALMFAVASVSALSTLVMLCCDNLLSRRGVAPLTFPSTLCTWTWILGCSVAFQSYFPIDETRLNSQEWQNPVNPNIELASEYDLIEILLAPFRGYAQVFFQADALTGFLIGLAIFVSSPLGGVLSLLGSVLALVFSMLLGVPASQLEPGLFGYNAILTSLASGGFFFIWYGKRVRLLFFFGILLSVLVMAATQSLFAPLGFPSLTLPFVFSVWILQSIGKSINGLFAVPFHRLSCPENHLRKIKLASVMSKGFVEKYVFSIDTIKDLNAFEKELIPLIINSAAASNDDMFLNSLLQTGCKLEDFPDDSGRTALHVAARCGRVEVTGVLVAGSPSCINLLDEFGLTPLDNAILSGCDEVCSILKSNGACIGQDILQWGITCCQSVEDLPECYLLMALRYGYSCVPRDEEGKTPLQIACALNNKALAGRLLNERPELLNVIDSHGNTCLDEATKFGSLELSKFLVASGAVEGHKLLRLGSPPISLPGKLLLSLQAERKDTPAFDKFGDEVDEKSKLQVNSTRSVIRRTLLSYFLGKGEDLSHMLAKAEDVVYRTFDWRTPLHLACAEGKRDIVLKLLHEGYDPNCKDIIGRTPLWEALVKENVKIAEDIKLYGGVLRPTCHCVRSALFDCVRKSNLRLLNLASRFGCPNLMNIQNYDKRTLLHLAVVLRMKTVCVLLIQLNVDKTVTDRWGKTASDIALERGDTEFVGLLSCAV